MMLTQHAQQRLRERLPGADPDMLWTLSRTADRTDLESFSACLSPDHTYRVAIWRGRRVLMVIGRLSGKLITVIVR